MIIYGVALLATCLVTGMIAGEYLGVAIGVEANVGGVGIAMLLLVVACNMGRFKLPVDGPSGEGIKFWSAMYIPIVVAMAARWRRDGMWSLRLTEAYWPLWLAPPSR